ncbi:hypothetical protein HPB47_017042 [Ixodes persulcatus]|uniref:Uncharacterized protein n=1 Tax=Ixodes persulcatus TaxID=34615 RepID=A0AC60QRB2_IXOPE|nr:hypothetical protein HPB47_017042 [Ixodes persulcatus]
MSLEPVCQLVEFQWNLTFKLAPKLRPELLDPNHFEKMKVIETFIVMSSNREQEDSSDEFRDSGSDMSVDTEEEPDVPSESQSDIDLGADVETTLRLLSSIKIFTVLTRLYYYYQKGYLLSSVKQLYERRNTELLEGLRGKAIDLAGDGRCDSPRFSAKYCIYTFNEETTKKFIPMEQKLQAASRSGFCKELEVWIQPVTNHLYFCAMMGECNGPLLARKPPDVRPKPRLEQLVGSGWDRTMRHRATSAVSLGRPAATQEALGPLSGRGESDRPGFEELPEARGGSPRTRPEGPAGASDGTSGSLEGAVPSLEGTTPSLKHEGGGLPTVSGRT